MEGSASFEQPVQKATGTREKQAADRDGASTRAGRICLEHRSATAAAGQLSDIPNHHNDSDGEVNERQRERQGEPSRTLSERPSLSRTPAARQTKPPTNQDMR